MKTNKTNTALIEHGHTEALNREWNAIQEERAAHTITDDQLDAILGELIDTLDQHFIESAFNFRDNLNATQGHWSKHPYLLGFIKKLNPLVPHLEEKLRNALPHRYVDRPGEPDSDLTQLRMDTEECAYVIGIFMGAKLTGASDERLNLLRKHLVF